MGLTRSRDGVHHRPDGVHLKFSSYLASSPHELSYLIALSAIFISSIFLINEVKGDGPKYYVTAI